MLWSEKSENYTKFPSFDDLKQNSDSGYLCICATRRFLGLREKEDIILIVSLYVDDLIFTGNDELMFAKFKSSMKHEFDMTDLGKMRYFLGLEVMQRINGIFLCKKICIRDAAKVWNG